MQECVTIDKVGQDCQHPHRQPTSLCPCNVPLGRWGVLQECVAGVCCSTVHERTCFYVDTLCNTLQPHCNRLQQTATHCNTLQHTATHCSTLQHTATYCNVLQRTETHCNALQCTAAHCNTLQHTATHCMTSKSSGSRRYFVYTDTLQQHCNTLQLHCNTQHDVEIERLEALIRLH